MTITHSLHLPANESGPIGSMLLRMLLELGVGLFNTADSATGRLGAGRLGAGQFNVPDNSARSVGKRSGSWVSEANPAVQPSDPRRAEPTGSEPHRPSAVCPPPTLSGSGELRFLVEQWGGSHSKMSLKLLKDLDRRSNY